MQSHCADQSDSAVACEQVCGPPSKDDSGLHDVPASQTLSLEEIEKERHSWHWGVLQYWPWTGEISLR